MNKVSVLIVDDAAFIRDLVKKGLRVHFPGIRIEEAVNGRKAQQYLSRNEIDLILCDWEMPEMSGLELLAWCRSDDAHQTTPFIMVTSRGDKENVVQAVKAGVTDYIGKPFTSEQLLGKVKKALHQSGRLEALASGTNSQSAYAMAGDSVSALTGARVDAAKSLLNAPPVPGASAAGKPAVSATAPKPAVNKSLNNRGRGQLRLSGGILPCLIKDLSLKDASVLIKSASLIPQVLESAVLDLEQGEGGEVARLNGYVHAIAAAEPRADSEWLQLVLRFVDSDPKKLDYLSRQIARGTQHRHFVPGA